MRTKPVFKALIVAAAITVSGHASTAQAQKNVVGLDVAPKEIQQKFGYQESAGASAANTKNRRAQPQKKTRPEIVGLDVAPPEIREYYEKQQAIWDAEDRKKNTLNSKHASRNEMIKRYYESINKNVPIR